MTRTPNPDRPVLPQRRFLQNGAAAVLGLQAGQQAALIGYGPDRLLEAMWARWDDDELPTKIATVGFDLVTSPDYSVYADQPRAEQLFNMRRSLLTAQDLADAGCNVAPAIYGGRREDLDRWLEWIDSSRLRWIFLPRHTLRLDHDFDQYAVPALTYLAAHLPEQTSVLISGLSTGPRIELVGRLFGPRLHIVTQAPLQHSSHGRAIVAAGGRIAVHGHHADMVAHNLRTLDGMVNTAIGDNDACVPADRP